MGLSWQPLGACSVLVSGLESRGVAAGLPALLCTQPGSAGGRASAPWAAEVGSACAPVTGRGWHGTRALSTALRQEGPPFGAALRTAERALGGGGASRLPPAGPCW